VRAACNLKGKYIPEDAAHGFVAADLQNPSGTLVLFTVRPDRWLTADFSDAAG
jgi:hypothetical protein